MHRVCYRLAVSTEDGHLAADLKCRRLETVLTRIGKKSPMVFARPARDQRQRLSIPAGAKVRPKAPKILPTLDSLLGSEGR
jgi:hypothetical protein